MTLQAAFIFLSPDANIATTRGAVNTNAVALTVVGARDYSEASAVARELVVNGITAIELCGGFGHKGLARIVDAVEGKASVGAVRFDSHPGLSGASGDSIFS